MNIFEIQRMFQGSLCTCRNKETLSTMHSSPYHKLYKILTSTSRLHFSRCTIGFPSLVRFKPSKPECTNTYGSILLLGLYYSSFSSVMRGSFEIHRTASSWCPHSVSKVQPTSSGVFLLIFYLFLLSN